MERLRYCFVLATAWLLAGCQQPTMLERVQRDGELIVATRMGPTTLYQGAKGYTGLEYDLATRFAEHLGVEVRFVVIEPLDRLLEAVKRGEVHMAAAGLTVTAKRRRELCFSYPYQSVTQQLVYRRGSGRPRSLDELGDGLLKVVAGSSHDARLSELDAFGLHDLQWQRTRSFNVGALLARVDEGTLAYTIANSNELALLRRYFAYVAPAFDVSEPLPVAWAFARWPDHSLVSAANDFLRRLEIEGMLGELLEYYYGFEDQLNFVDKREFWRHVEGRLPSYQAYFEEAAQIVGLDWRLLAAIGYQESHWNPDAVSPTGVRGIMMLTRDTARHVGVEDRTDPRASIVGGSRYLRMIEAKLPERIEEPDRLWLTLAGYNVGFGHLEDARILTQRQGGNPDRWAEVRERLPLLARKEHYRTLEYGYARGHEPVKFVENIRNYYDLLVWHTNNRPDPTRLVDAALEIPDG